MSNSARSTATVLVAGHMVKWAVMESYLAHLPPPILTSEPGSFARRTFEVRIPRIVDDTLASNAFPPEIVRSLVALRDEITAPGGTIQPLREAAPDRAFWDAHSRAYVGRSWLDVPWYWAEAYFYRRVLEAVRYFQPGPWQRRDPFAPPKEKELEPAQGPRALAAILEALPDDPAERFRALVHASLWGNRADLSYNVAQNVPGSLVLEREHANLIVDDVAAVWDYLNARRGGRVDFICDNAGTELLFDFALADFLLQTGLAGRAVFHFKPQPFYVSDAMVKDARAALAALAREPTPELNQVARRLEQALQASRYAFVEHWFWVTSLFFFELPEDLAAELARADLVISKGDANYRRWLGDRHWPLSTRFVDAVRYFPGALVALRTLKAELVVGLSEGEAQRLQAQDPTWMTDGQRGVVQFKV